MKRITASCALGVILAGLAAAGPDIPLPRGEGAGFIIPNEAIDFEAFQEVVKEAGEHRRSRRITEEQFLQMAGEENTIILDTRSADKFALLHVKGAVHLNFSEITKDSLARAIPDRETRILIYCNNNFDGAPVSMARKAPAAALNIPTFLTLYSYGYRNLYELGPLLDVRKTRIPLEGARFAAHVPALNSNQK